jgi:hypothetical protein
MTPFLLTEILWASNNIGIEMKGELSEKMEDGRGETSVIHALARRNLRKP